jgi:hypothetical protein
VLIHQNSRLIDQMNGIQIHHTNLENSFLLKGSKQIHHLNIRKIIVFARKY